MNTIYATGTKGTIGKHLPLEVTSINQDLSKNKFAFKHLSIQKNSNFIHLAGVVGAKAVKNNVEYSRAVNIEGTVFLAEEFLSKSSGKFYFVSTSHVYSPSEKNFLESSPLGPTNIYAEQKLEAEKLLQIIFQNDPKRLCIIRVFSVLDWDVPPFTLGGAIKRLANQDDGFVLRNGLDVRDFLTPSSIAKSLYEIALKGKLNGIVNLCTGHGISVGEAAHRMLTSSGLQVPEHRIILEHSDNPVMVGDNSRLKSFHPELNLKWYPSKMDD